MTRTPLSTTLDAYEIWFVTGSQTLYGDETLRQVAEQSQAVAAGLGELPVKVVWKPNTLTPLDQEKAETLLKLVDALDEDDDVQNVFSNADIPDEVMAKLDA